MARSSSVLTVMFALSWHITVSVYICIYVGAAVTSFTPAPSLPPHFMCCRHNCLAYTDTYIYILDIGYIQCKLFYCDKHSTLSSHRMIFIEKGVSIVRLLYNSHRRVLTKLSDLAARKMNISLLDCKTCLGM